MQKILILIIVTLSWFVSYCAYALSSDSKKELHIEADWSHLDHKTGICTYYGHVKLTQGTTVITADKAITYINKQNQLEKAVAIGKLASYSTLPDNSQLEFVALADTINYYPLQTLVELVGDASATQGKDSFAGPHMFYNTTKQTVTSPPSTQGRTTIILQPDQKLSTLTHYKSRN